MVQNRASWVWAEAPRYLEWQSRRHFRFHDGPVPAPERKWRGPEFCTQQQVFRQGEFQFHLAVDLGNEEDPPAVPVPAGKATRGRSGAVRRGGRTLSSR